MPPLLVFGHPTQQMLARLAEHFEIHTLAEKPEGWLADHGAGIRHATLVGHGRIDGALLDLLPDLQLISNYGVGYDTIDAAECARRGVLVTHTPDVLNAEVATTAILLMMACYRELLRDEAYVRSGRWEAEGSAPLTRSVDGQKVGILGMGRIGQEIARKLAVFDPEISYHTRSPKDVPFRYFDSLVEMAAHVDCLMVITPGGAATHHLVNREVLEALGPQGTVVNVARGTVIDETAMIDCLQSGKLGWAGLDVFEREPHVPEALRALSNVVLLPHVGSGTVETRAAMGNLVVDNLIDHLTLGTVRTPVPECRALAGMPDS